MKDDYSYNNYGQQESRDGDKWAHFYISQPDNRFCAWVNHYFIQIGKQKKMSSEDPRQLMRRGSSPPFSCAYCTKNTASRVGIRSQKYTDVHSWFSFPAIILVEILWGNAQVRFHHVFNISIVNRTEGSYYVLLPDGRTQYVKYYVDGYSGFVVSFQCSPKNYFDQIDTRMHTTC